MNTHVTDRSPVDPSLYGGDPDDRPFPQHSPTEAAIESIVLHRMAPQAGEPDYRQFPEADDLAQTLRGAMTSLSEVMDGTRLEDDAQELLWGVTNVMHRRLQFIDKLLDENETDQRAMAREQDGSEVKSVELERKLDEGERLVERRTAFEFMRDLMAEEFAALTGTPWVPRSGSRVSHANVTSAVIDSRKFRSAKRRKDIEIHCPDGTRVAVTGGQDFQDYRTVTAALDATHAKYPDMVLLHGGATKGVELIAARWAEAKSVPQVVFKPDWTAHGKSAPFKRNDRLLEEMPQGLIAFPGNGINENLADKARKLGIRVHRPVKV